MSMFGFFAGSAPSTSQGGGYAIPYYGSGYPGHYSMAMSGYDNPDAADEPAGQRDQPAREPPEVR